jgi:F-type H+-transporting ATPase subunit a
MTRRPLTLTLFAWLSCLVPAFASEAGGEASLPLNASPVFESFPYVSNSMLMVWLAVAIITVFCRIATKKMALVPAGFQNFAEWLVESLYDFLASLLGDYMVKKTFWFFASVFLLILVTNWIGLIPGVGTVGTYNEHGHIVGYLRGGNADLNMTMAMALTFAVLWFYWALTENGIGGFLHHIFAPKGTFHGMMLVMMVPIFLAVGVLEIISIMIRPVALTFRLFGNIYGGEQTLEKLMALVPAKLAFLPALPFYFMELLVGLVQALVFMLLTAVFLRLICEHAGEEAHH